MDDADDDDVRCCIAFFDSISQSQPHLPCSLLAEPLRTLAQTGHSFSGFNASQSASNSTNSKIQNRH